MSWGYVSGQKLSALNPPAACETGAEAKTTCHWGTWPLWESRVALRDQETFHYLGVKLPGIVQEGQADFLQSPDFTRVVLEALEHAAAHISSIHQTVLDLG